MSFTHHPYQPGETVAAIATPIGEGGVAIVRISGKDAVAVADRIFSGPVSRFPTHTAHYGHIIDEEGKPIDSGLALPMLGKRSFTGEDTVEIHCHGGALITRRVLDRVLEAGARQAMPGEFTFKAFMNGKIDLAQAEAIQELIAAKNDHALNAAEQQLQGKLSEKVRGFQEKLSHIAAILEAWVDFPDEDLEFASFDDVIQQLKDICREIEALLATYHDGKIVSEGVALCLVGSPNVGKSSLMNAMLDRDRAIVSDIPGTTRDVLEDNLKLSGLNFRLTDTAGIRETEDRIEKEGVIRSRKALLEADLVLCVLDLIQGLSPSDQQLLDTLPRSKTIIVWNKADLPHTMPPSVDFPCVVKLSARTREGFDAFKAAIDAVIWESGPPSKEEVLITNSRHKEAIALAGSFCKKVVTGLEKRISPEFVAMDMRASLLELGKVIGTDVTEDILTAIFSNFCIGK